LVYNCINFFVEWPLQNDPARQSSPNMLLKSLALSC
jgi:hypothetical protein